MCSAEVSQVVFGNPAEEEGPVIRCVKLGKFVEVFYGLGVFAVGKSVAAPEIEYVLIVLGEYRLYGTYYYDKSE